MTQHETTLSDEYGLLVTDEAAEYIGVTKKSVEVWRQVGKGPCYYKAGTAVLYAVDDLDKWLADQGRSRALPFAPPAHVPPGHFTGKQVAGIASLTVSAFYALVHKGNGPEATFFTSPTGGRRRYYLAEHVHTWLASRWGQE